MVPALPPKASFVRLPPHRQIFRPALSYRLSYTYIILSFTLYHTFAAMLYTFYSDTSYIYSFLLLYLFTASPKPYHHGGYAVTTDEEPIKTYTQQS